MAAWPLVVNWLVTTLPTLPGWSAVKVFDGPPVTGSSPLIYATVGYVADDAAGSFTETPSANGVSDDEQGTVRCDLVVNSGETSMSAARVTAFTLRDALRAKLLADQTLDGLLSLSRVELTTDVVSIQNSAGVAQQLILTVAYSTFDWPS